MEFVNIRELKLKTNKVLAKSKKKGPLLITRRNQPVAIVRSIDEDDLDINISHLWKRIRLSAEQAGFGPEDVEKLIRTARQRKLKKPA